ncbi:MAG TPA: DUF4870 domain-containing protein [Nitriliruptorales bacterium]
MARTCPSCGTEAVADDAAHCHRCGAGLDVADAPWSGTEDRSATGDAPGKDSTNWAMGAHLSAFLGAWVALAFIGPLVVWLIKREDDPFVERHAREALNFNLLLLILVIIGLAGSILTLGFGAILFLPLLVIAGTAWLVLTIVATVKAANGEEYSYPFNIHLVK